jgi:hypothetical protein
MYGHYKYLVMPFRMVNTSALFQKMINAIIKDMIDPSIVIYIYDILIYSQIKEEHKKCIKTILSQL